MANESDKAESKSCAAPVEHAEPLSQQIFGWMKDKVDAIAETTPCKLISENNAKAADAFTHLPLVQFVEEGISNKVEQFKDSDFAAVHVKAADQLSHTSAAQHIDATADALGRAVDNYIFQPFKDLDQHLGDVAAKNDDKAEAVADKLPKTMIV